MFASQDIAQDVVLFDEKPLVCAQFIWNALYKYLACDHCLKSLETAQVGKMNQRVVSINLNVKVSLLLDF